MASYFLHPDRTFRNKENALYYFMLSIHITIAVVSILYWAFLSIAHLAKKLHEGQEHTTPLAISLLATITSGIVLSLSSHTPIISVCDSIAFYITLCAITAYIHYAYTTSKKHVLNRVFGYSFSYAVLVPVVLIAIGF